MTVMTNQRGKPIAIDVGGEWLCTKEFLNKLYKSPLLETQHTGSMFGSLYGIRLTKTNERYIRKLIAKKKKRARIKIHSRPITIN